MDIAISYFYQIRFFKPYMVPLSTAMWDPKWFHNFKGQDTAFIDRNGVINGLRMNMLVPGSSCDGLCYGVDKCKSKDPATCAFLREYEKQIYSINWDEFKYWLKAISTFAVNELGLTRFPMLVFMVYEKYDNPCSEREVLLKWFHSKGLDVEELNYPISDNY